MVIPVCLSGRGNFVVRRDDKTDDVRAVLNVIPGAGHTFVAVAVLKRHRDALELFKGLFLGDAPSLIAAVETWMIHGTDHWFVDPSVWARIVPSKAREILDDILDDAWNIGTRYEKTIFNELKRGILQRLAEKTHRPDETKRVVAEENRRVTDV